MHPGASDTSFLERAATVWGGGSQTSQHQHQLFRRAPQPLHFVLHHMQVFYFISFYIMVSSHIYTHVS